MSEITVRAARAADEGALLTLADAEMQAHELMDERFRLRPDAHDRYAVYLRSRMRDLDSTVFVAHLEEKVVGLAIGSIRKQDGFFRVQRYGYISDLMVSPSARRRGVGRALYERTVLWFRGLGIGVIRLHIATRSDEARAFWRSVGASDFLTEAWIDIGGETGDATESTDASRATTPPAPSAAPAPARTGDPASSPERGSPGHEFLGDALLGGPEGGF